LRSRHPLQSPMRYLTKMTNKARRYQARCRGHQPCFTPAIYPLPLPTLDREETGSLPVYLPPPALATSADRCLMTKMSKTILSQETDSNRSLLESYLVNSHQFHQAIVQSLKLLSEDLVTSSLQGVDPAVSANNQAQQARLQPSAVRINSPFFLRLSIEMIGAGV